MINKHIKKHFQSYKFAFNGIVPLAKEVNFWAEIIILVSIIVFPSLCYILKLKFWSNNINTIRLISKTQLIFSIINLISYWLLLVAAEAFNTSLEYFVNHIFQKYHINAKIIKDLSALAVFLVAMFLLIQFLLLMYQIII